MVRVSPPLEHDEQATVIEWAEWQKGRWPELELLAAVPNGGARHKAVAAKLKAEGVRAGYPDLLLDVARGGYHGLRVEMKRQKGGRLSAAQLWWHERLRAEGYMVVIAEGAQNAIEAIRGYLTL